MADRATDRNLLFGLLALQLNFVSRPQLVAAFDRWTADKGRSLSQILVEQGALDGDEHALLEALARKHVERHDNDPQKSLADLTPVGSARDDLERLADPELEASLAYVSAARGDDENGLPSTLAFPVGTPTSAGTRFRVLRPHARGGLGEVYVAVDEELHREVALKEIQKRHADEPDSRARFLLEAEITGGLEHPGIVPVYGLGSYADGRPFYAMRFIRGDSLKEAIEHFHNKGVGKDAFSSLEFRKLLGRFIDVCNAIEYAHSRGVLHRDLKPGNIMLGKYGETLVVDWGLAKVVGRRHPQPTGEESTLHPTAGSGSTPTEMGRAVGTPQFMSPEQAEGRLDQLGPASDVYSLGATLYTLLTGQPPFAKDDTRDVVDRVAQGDFPRPREVNPEVPQGLEAVCLKAMALAPAGRYKSPQSLASDIEHWLADEPVSALHDTLVERAARWARRHRALARAAAVALLVISVVSVSAALVVDRFRRDEHTARQMADRAAKRADKERLSALAAERNAEQAVHREKVQRIEAEHQARLSETLRLAGQSQLASPDQPVRSVQLALEAVQLADEHDTASLAASRQALRDSLSVIGGRPLVGYLPRTSERFWDSSVAFSLNGRWLAAPGNGFTAQLWDLGAPRLGAPPVILNGHSARVQMVAFDPHCRWLATASDDGTARLWDLNSEPTGHLAALILHQSPVTFLEFSPNGRWLTSLAANGEARLWDLSASDLGHASIVLERQAMSDWAVLRRGFQAFSANSRWLITIRADGTSHLRNLQAADPARRAPVLVQRRASLSRPEFSADSRWLTVAGDDGVIYLWELSSDDSARGVELHNRAGGVERVALSADGHWLVAASTDGTTQLWDLTSPDMLATGAVLDDGPAFTDENEKWFLAFSPDSHWLITSRRMNNTRDSHHASLWNLAGQISGVRPTVIQAPASDFWHLKFSQDSRWVAEASNNNVCRLWDLSEEHPAKDAVLLGGHSRTIGDARFSPDGSWLATGSWDGTVRLWNLMAGRTAAEPAVLRGHDDQIDFMTFSGDGRWLATETLQGTARLWDLTRRDFLAGCVVLYEQKTPRFSGDGHWLATDMTEKDTSRLWDLTATDPYGEPMAIAGSSPTFDPRGRWLATTSNDGTTKLFDLSELEPTATEIFTRGKRHLWAVAISENGKFLVECAPDRLWLRDLSSTGDGDGIIVEGGYSSPVFSADGRWLAAIERSVRVLERGSKVFEHSGFRLWNLASKDEADNMITIKGKINGLAFSADSRWLAMAEEGNPVRMFDLTAADPVEASVTLWDIYAYLQNIAFSPDGHWFAASRGTRVDLCETGSNGLPNDVVSLDADSLDVAELAFDKSGRWLAAASFDGTARLWDLTMTEPSGSSITLRGHEGYVHAVAFSPDGKWLATGGSDRTVRLWPVEDAELMRRAAAAIGREITQLRENTNRVGAAGRKTQESQHSTVQLEAQTAAEHMQNAQWYAQNRRYRRAVADFARAAEIDPTNAPWPVYLEGVAELAMGDVEGYKRTWHKLYKQFKDAGSRDPGDPFGRIIYGFIPGNPEPTLAAEVVRMAGHFAEKNPGWKRVLGGALLRAGQYADSVQTFAEAAKYFAPRAWDLLLMAIAQEKNGQSIDARKSYQAAVVWIKENESSEQWWERVEVELLRAEAERLFQEAEKGE